MLASPILWPSPCSGAEFYSIRKGLEDILPRVEAARKAADVPRLEAELANLEKQAGLDSLWDEPSQAQVLLGRLAEIKEALGEVKEFQSKVQTCVESSFLSAALRLSLHA